MLKKEITFCGQAAVLCCDGNCKKAWGRNCRPKEQLSNDDDDWEFLSDDELGEAPSDPGTYEGGYGKPDNASMCLNKWCARECERSELLRPDEAIVLKDFSKRIRNKP
jgi:hypothetical protein